MNTQYFHLPPTHVVKVEEPSARGLNMTSGENVKGQNYNICAKGFRASSAQLFFNLWVDRRA